MSGYVTYRRTQEPFEERICAQNASLGYHEGIEHPPTADRPDFRVRVLALAALGGEGLAILVFCVHPA